MRTVRVPPVAVVVETGSRQRSRQERGDGNGGSGVNGYQLSCGDWQSDVPGFRIGDLFGCIRCDTRRTVVIGMSGGAEVTGGGDGGGTGQAGGVAWRAGEFGVPAGVVRPGGFGTCGEGQAPAGSWFLPVPAASTVHRLIVPATKTWWMARSRSAGPTPALRSAGSRSRISFSSRSFAALRRLTRSAMAPTSASSCSTFSSTPSL